ncbi:MAG: hypothetical protein NT099_01555 [Candidatus Saganbacteria bacterium]|nr:hypothetical protein [Candidatus Saganbacteria bacterium]
MSITQLGGGYNISNAQIGVPTRVMQNAAVPEMVVPDGFEIRKRIWQEFQIQVLDSDVKFSGAECQAIEESLKEIKKKKKEHLIGVLQVVKNQEQRVRLQAGLHIHAGGAYDPENKRVLIFDNLKEEEYREVIVHEVGHAVSYFNMEFEQFMRFVSGSGYKMFEMRKYYVPGSQFFQIALKKVELPPEEWDKVMERFSMNTLTKNQDIFGEIIVELGRKKQNPWDENPLEQFAWAYEWYMNKNKQFLATALQRAEIGDQAWLNDYAFMREEIFQ